MLPVFLRLHVHERLKQIHITGIAAMFVFFCLLFYLGSQVEMQMLYAEIITLAMAAFITLSYFSLVFHPKDETSVPLVLLFALNLATTLLVWATGILQSPFILLYAIIIIVTAQMYRYVHGLVQAVMAFMGFMTVYAVTIYEYLPYIPLLPATDKTFLAQPPSVTITYALLYATLFLFAIFSSSSARTFFYRPLKDKNLDFTFQEKIIQNLPIGVLVLDEQFHILGNNPAAAVKFPTKIPSPLAAYLKLSQKETENLMRVLAKSGEKKHMMWHAGSSSPISTHLTTHLMKGNSRQANTYIVFLED